MRILIANDIPIQYVCGSSNFIRGISKEFIREGHEVLIVTPARTTHHEYYVFDGIPQFGVRSYPSIVQKTFRIVPPIFIKQSMRKAILQLDPNVVHIQSQFFIPKLVLDIAEELNIAAVGTNHFVPENAMPYIPVPKAIVPFIERLLWKQVHWIYKKCDLVTSPTQTAVNFLVKSGFPKPVYPVSNGITLERFSREHANGQIREKYHLPAKRILLYVGRVDAEKHIEVVVKALPAVLAKVDLHFVVAGRGNQEEKLINLAKDLHVGNNVTLTGYVPDEDLPALFRTSDCFVNAGTAELQCIAAMEAMASEIPVILANAIALPELVDHGVSGYLFRPGDERDLAEKIIDMFSDDSRRLAMGQQSFEKVKKHDVRNVAKRFLELYAQAVQIQHNSRS